MAFGIDDIAAGLAKVGEVKSEAGLESVELLGDGLGEMELRDDFELNNIETGSDNIIIGDGLGEEELSSINEGASSGIELGGEIHNSLQNESTKEMIGQNPLDDATDSTPEIERSGIEKCSSNIEPIPEHPDNINDVQTDKNENIQPPESLDNTTLDDTGKPYMKDGELIPNNTYEINGTKYETDEKGRIIRAETSVEINNTPRPSLNSRKVDGLEPGDDKGHIVAHILGGADTEGNLVAMDSKLNRGEYKSMELSAKRAREEDKEVLMTVDIEYDGDRKRPKSFLVTLEIDDEITIKKFLNNKNE